MKLAILYHPESESRRLVEDYAHDFEHRKGSPIELISLETKQGSDMAKLYGIVQYPAMLAVRNDGQLLKHWEGETLPLMDEAAAYLAP